MLAGKLSVVCWLVVSERAGPIALGRGSSVTNAARSWKPLAAWSLEQTTWRKRKIVISSYGKLNLLAKIFCSQSAVLVAVHAPIYTCMPPCPQQSAAGMVVPLCETCES